MGETHSKGEQRHQPLTLASTDNRSAMARASDGRPFRSYVYGGEREEPPAVVAARERHRALNAEIERRREQLASGHCPAPEQGGGDGRD